MATGASPSPSQTRIFQVTHCQYYIADDGGSVPMPQDTDLIDLIFPGVGGSGGALVTTGTGWGPVEVTVQVLDAPPDPVGPSGEWEQSDEAALVALGEHVLVREPDGQDRGLRRLEVEPGQTYHVRVRCRGRQAGREYGAEIPEAPAEAHLVQLWADD